jgi:hypothetical protein
MEAFGLLLGIGASLIACLVTANILARSRDQTMRIAVVVGTLLIAAACADAALSIIRGACGSFAIIGTSYLWLTGLTTIGAPPATIALVVAGGRRVGLSRLVVISLAVVAGFTVAVVVLSRNLFAGDALYGIDGSGGCATQRWIAADDGTAK